MALARTRNILALIFLICQLVLPLTALPLQAAETPSQSSNEELAPPDSRDEGTKGVAAYYAKRYNGRKTCSGARYDPEKLTAAHPTLPFGTRVRVVNLSNDRDVIVTINDRCRQRSYPLIDLSRAAARKLGFLGKGTTKVRTTVLVD